MHRLETPADGGQFQRDPNEQLGMRGRAAVGAGGCLASRPQAPCRSAACQKPADDHSGEERVASVRDPRKRAAAGCSAFGCVRRPSPKSALTPQSDGRHTSGRHGVSRLAGIAADENVGRSRSAAEAAAIGSSCRSGYAAETRSAVSIRGTRARSARSQRLGRRRGSLRWPRGRDVIAERLGRGRDLFGRKRPGRRPARGRRGRRASDCPRPGRDEDRTPRVLSRRLKVTGPMDCVPAGA